MKKYPFISILLCGIFFADCTNATRKSAENVEEENDVATEIVNSFVKLDPLPNETLRLKNRNPFGETIELTGELFYVDELIFKPSEIELIIKDNLLVMKSRTQNGVFSLLSLPDLKPTKTIGRLGGGPDEFMFPVLFQNTNPEVLASVFEMSNGKTYNILRDGTLLLNDVRIPQKGNSPFGNGEFPAIMTDSLFYFAGNSTNGKSVFTIAAIDSSQTINEIQNLALDPRRKGWANYIGDFAVNPAQNRMVYAYKYFKIVRFFDTENNTVRTINFEREELDENSQYRVDGLDANVTHYWGVSAGEKYVYFLYSGRTPMQVMNDNRKGNYHIFVEKYDWNGNPIAKYKLDQWGYFTVDEKNNTLYLVSTNDDSAFFVYRL